MAESDRGEVICRKISLLISKPNPISSEMSEDLQVKGSQVFGNSLIVKHICCFASSTNELLQFRLINHTFQQEATLRFRRCHKQIWLRSNSRIQEFLICMKPRESLKLTPFPFTSFEVDLNLSRENLENFGAAIGPHIKRYYLRPYLQDFDNKNAEEFSKKVGMLLSHSPQVTEMQLDNYHEFVITEQDIRLLPTAFPNLAVIRITNEHITREETGSFYPLLELLISRATNLNKIKIPTRNPTLILRILRFLGENRPRNLPSISLEEFFRVDCDNSMLVIKDLVDLNFVVTDISIDISTSMSIEFEDQGRLRAITDFLEKQSSSLISVNVDIDIPVRAHDHISPFPFPILHSLKNLRIKFPGRDHRVELPNNSRPILPFVQNPFPALQTLQLDNYRDDYQMFGTSSMPSVQKLQLNFQRSPVNTDPSWHVAFPNLTSLHIQFDRDEAEIFRSALRCILTNLTRLVHLDLEVSLGSSKYYCPECNWGCWDILTGGAPRPRPALNIAFSYWKKLPEATLVQEPVKGIHLVPSLRNMRALKTLRFFPRLHSNLDAILFMTHTDQLVPLQKLVLSKLEVDKVFGLLDDQMIATYKDGLSKVHSEVKFMTAKYLPDKLQLVEADYDEYW